MPDPDEPADLPPPRRVELDLGGPVEGLGQAQAASERARASLDGEHGRLARLWQGEGAAQSAITESTTALIEAVTELSERVARIGDGLERTHDRIDEMAERETMAADRAREDRATVTALGQRLGELGRDLTAVRNRAEGALTQHEVTASVVADAEARLSAAIADLRQRSHDPSPDPSGRGRRDPGSSPPDVG